MLNPRFMALDLADQSFLWESKSVKHWWNHPSSWTTTHTSTNQHWGQYLKKKQVDILTYWHTHWSNWEMSHILVPTLNSTLSTCPILEAGRWPIWCQESWPNSILIPFFLHFCWLKHFLISKNVFWIQTMMWSGILVTLPSPPSLPIYSGKAL